MRGALVRLQGVRFAYPGRASVLDGVDFEAPPGRLTVVLGANGSGKTTLLRLAAGLARPTAGEVLVGDAHAHDASRAGHVGYIPQQLGLVRSASALDNVLVGTLGRASLARRALGLAPSDARDAALAALDTVGLREKADRPTRTLSGGERQRVAIARTLVQDPQVIVADELLASLDAVQSHAVMEVERALRRRGVTILMSLHQIDVALANADLVSFLARGRLSMPRPPEGLTAEEVRASLAA